MKFKPSRRGSALLVAVVAAGCSIYDSNLLGEAVNDDGLGGGGGSNAGDGDGTNGDGDGDGTGGVSGGQTGGSGMGGAPSGGSNSMGGGDGGPNVDLIDNLEDNEPNVLVSGGRNGRWNTYNDGTGGGTQIPAPDFTQMTDVSDDPPHAESDFAAYTQGSGFTGDFGAVLNVTMRSWPVYDETPPYDASEFPGLSFYAKVGAGANKSVRVRLITTDTDPRGENCIAGGATGEACYDHFLNQLTLTENWERYDIEFEDFSQTGVGKQFAAPALDGLFAIEFQCPPGSPFEVWIDDLGFIEP